MNKLTKISAIVIVVLTIVNIAILVDYKNHRTDINHDGVVDGLDLSILLNDWTKSE